MGVELKDVIRVQDTPANQMIAFDSTNDRFAYKDSGGVMKFVRDDTQQIHRDFTETMIGLKTFTQNVIMTASKLLTLDQIGGLRMVANDKYVFSDDDSGLVPDQMVSIFGGGMDIQDRNSAVTPFTPILKFFDFSTDAAWTKTAGFTISSGTLNFAHTDGTDKVFQNKGDFQSKIEAGQLYKMTYDIKASNGTPTVVVEALFPIGDVPIDLAVADSKVLYFLATDLTFEISVTSSIAGDTFSIDNIILSKVPGVLTNITELNDGVEITSNGDIQLTEASEKSGFIGGPGTIANRRGLQFDSAGNARFTNHLDVGGGNDPATGLMTDGWRSFSRMSIGLSGSVTTIGAVLDTILLEVQSGNVGISTLLLFIQGEKDDQSISYHGLFLVGIRNSGATLSLAFTPQVISENDGFGDTLQTFGVSGNDFQVKCTGSAGDTIFWTAQFLGHGDQLGEREF